ncbi:AraC family transcriptional regulator [Arenibacter aquaticus]|uniref:AraC family transcriptional regulator n=1 Tax=Arenibacter aquaticus TaxID=2489054 RepID=A0A430K8M2_9FLAO|nr:AraC family transcriptional regulator [Arenibacter aquaticus]RTE55410.1 AraC family transcriptional regulator [Arenibacter aquaticus]
MEERKVFNLQDYGVSRGLSFGHYKYREVKPGLTEHLHQGAVELCFSMSGRQTYMVGERLFELKGNDIFIVGPDVLHSTGNYPEDKGELFWIQILVDHGKGRLCNLEKEQSDFILNGLLEKSECIFAGAFQLKLILGKLALQLAKEPSVLSRLVVDQLITQLLLETLLLSKDSSPKAASTRLKTINDYIRQHLHRIIYVDELAGLVSMSTGYFKAWFKAESGMPPKEYVNRLKIEQAKLDLLQRRTVTQVAFDLGFGSSQYFATTFKKFTGYTPRSYIRSLEE